MCYKLFESLGTSEMELDYKIPSVIKDAKKEFIWIVSEKFIPFSKNL